MAIPDVIVVNPVLITETDTAEKRESGSVTPVGNGTGQTKASGLRRMYGISLMLICSVLVTTQGSLIKYIGKIPTGQVVMIIAFYSTCFYTCLVFYFGVSLTRFPYKKYIFQRTALGGMGFCAKVWSYQNLPYGDANALIFTIPFFAGIIARFYLKEKYTIANILATLAGLAGIVLIAKPNFIFSGHQPEDSPGWKVVIPLGTAMFMGWAYVCVRKAGSSVSPIVVSFYQVVFQFLAGTIVQFATRSSFVTPDCSEQRGLLVVCAFLTIGGYIALNKGLAVEKSSTATLIRNVDTVLAYIIQIWVFKQTADAFSLAGAALIVAGTVTIATTRAFDLTCGCEI